MGAVKDKIFEAEESISFAKEQLTEAIELLESVGMKNKCGRLKEALTLLTFDIWEDVTMENIRSIEATVRTAKRGPNSYFSARVYVSYYSGHCDCFTIPATYGYNYSSYANHIKERVNTELEIELPFYNSEIPFPFDIRVIEVKYKELHRGENA